MNDFERELATFTNMLALSNNQGGKMKYGRIGSNYGYYDDTEANKDPNTRVGTNRPDEVGHSRQISKDFINTIKLAPSLIEKIPVIGDIGSKTFKKIIDTVGISGMGLIQNPDVRQSKPKYEISNAVKRAKRIVSYDADKSFLFGTFIYKASPYPSDVDIREPIVECCGQEAIKKHAKHLQEILKNALKQKGVYFSEMKAGLDTIYKIPIGTLERYKIIHNYNPEQILENLNVLKKNKCLTNEEYKDISSLVVNNISVDNFEKLSDLLRNKYIIRWNADEVLKGVKKLPCGREITLEEALDMKTYVKQDYFIDINDRYVEVTNFFLLDVKNKDGSIRPLNLPYLSDEFDLPEIVQELSTEVEKFYFSKKYYKPLKMVKRLFSIARLIDDKAMMKNIVPLLQSNVAKLGQIVSEIDNIISMLERIKEPPITSLKHQIDSFKDRMSNIIDIEFDQKKLDIIIDKIVNSKFEKGMDIKLLTELKKYINMVVNHETEIYLKEHNLAPPPDSYLPKYPPPIKTQMGPSRSEFKKSQYEKRS